MLHYTRIDKASLRGSRDKKKNRIIIKITMIRLEKNVKNENKKEY